MYNFFLCCIKNYAIYVTTNKWKYTLTVQQLYYKPKLYYISFTETCLILKEKEEKKINKIKPSIRGTE